MTAAATSVQRRLAVPERLRGLRARRGRQARGEPGGDAPAVPPLSPRAQLVRAALVVVCVLSSAVLLQYFVISRWEHTANQGRAFDRLRAELAEGIAPIGPTDASGAELALGTPVAYLEIPTLGVRQVVGEGTSPDVMIDGPGHRRDTPLPGQIGTSVVFGRRTAFGGPFGEIGRLVPGDLVKVTTGQGVFEFRVTGVRREGSPLPPPAEPGSGRLLLITADGSRFAPSGVLRVDAELDGTAVVGPARLIAGSALPEREKAMSNDTSTVWALALWLQALIGASVAAVWAWYRWGRAQAWIVFLPPLLFLGSQAWGEFARLLPNLM